MSESVKDLRSGAQLKPLPSQFGIGFHRFLADMNSYFSRVTTVIMSFAFPVIILLITGAIYGNNTVPGIGKISHVIVAGSVAVGIFNIGFLALSIVVTAERQYGILRRLFVTTFSGVSYVVSRCFYVLFLTILQVIFIMLVGSVAFGSPLPADGIRWLAFFGVLILGMLCATAFGVFLGILSRRMEAITTFVTFPFLILQFISGIFYPISFLAPPLQIIASIFPLKWMAQGFRYALYYRTRLE